MQQWECELRDGAVTSFGRHVVILSPHLDDVAFSMPGTLEYMRRSGAGTATLITVFTRSNYTLTGYPSGVDEVSALRKKEDLSFIHFFPSTRAIWLDFPDAPLRPGFQQCIVCTPGPFAVVDQMLSRRLELVLQDLPHSIEAVFSPMSLGSHIDHRIVLRAAIAFAGVRGIPLFLYEDLPYAAQMTMEAIITFAKLMEPMGGRPMFQRLLRLPEMSEIKISAASHYTSQLHDQLLRDIEFHLGRLGNGLCGGERIWELGCLDD